MFQCVVLCCIHVGVSMSMQ